jgi:hypothetical protein
MNTLATPKVLSDATLVQLAREIAIEIFPVEDILKHHRLSVEQFERIKETQRFQDLLYIATGEWQSALNTHERVKIKSAAAIEDWLVEAYAKLHDNTEALPAKVELAKVLTRLAGMGLTNAEVNGAAAERFHITINLGQDANLNFDKEITTIPAISDQT